MRQVHVLILLRSVAIVHYLCYLSVLISLFQVITAVESSKTNSRHNVLEVFKRSAV
jgi:hypothetical protein